MINLFSIDVDEENQDSQTKNDKSILHPDAGEGNLTISNIVLFQLKEIIIY